VARAGNAPCPLCRRAVTGPREAQPDGPQWRLYASRHCEEPTGPARSGRPDDRLRDEAIQTGVKDLDCFASLAMTGDVVRFQKWY
jgi:hypothetical protein